MITLTLCFAAIIGYLSVSLALISVNLHQKNQKSRKGSTKVRKDQRRPSQKCHSHSMFQNYNQTTKCVFDLNQCQFTPKKYQKSKRPHKGQKRPSQKCHSHSMFTTIIGPLSVSLTFISVNSHQKNIKSPKATQRPEKAKTEMLLEFYVL